MALLRKKEYEYYVFHCPGCNEDHVIYTRNPGGPEWTFDGNMEKPTFSPSIKRTNHLGICHLVITKGEIHYCGDCFHEQQNKICQMVDLDRQ